MISHPARRGATAFLFGCLLLTLGCAGNGPPPSGGGSTFDVLQQTIFNVRCLSAGCHNSSDHQGDLVLENGIAYGALVSAAALNPAAQAAGLLRVVPADPDHSFLMIKLTGPGPFEGSPMPLDAPALSPQDIDRIRQWIIDGALAGSTPPVATPTATVPEPTASRTITPTQTPSGTVTMEPTLTATATSSPSPTITATGTLPPTATATATAPPTATASTTATAIPSASATSSATPTATTATLAQIQATIFDTTCLSLSCHNARDRAGNQVLEAGTSYADLVGVQPDNQAARSAGMRRVDPGNPDNSFLLVKLTLPSVFDLQLGSRMPLGTPVLSASQIDLIRAWIAAGAPQ